MLMKLQVLFSIISSLYVVNPLTSNDEDTREKGYNISIDSILRGNNEVNDDPILDTITTVPLNGDENKNENDKDESMKRNETVKLYHYRDLKSKAHRRRQRHPVYIMSYATNAKSAKSAKSAKNSQTSNASKYVPNTNSGGASPNIGSGEFRGIDPPTLYPTPSPIIPPLNPTLYPTPSPIIPPSSNGYPISEPSSFYDRFTALVKTISSETDLNDPNSFQRQALDCIVSDDLVLDKSVTDKYLLQRYAMVMLSFSFCGTCSDFAFDWDRMSSECDWSKIECNDNFIDVRDVVITSVDTGCTGTIPSELQVLDKMNFFEISNAGRVGTIPIELYDWPDIEIMKLQGNSLTGTIHTEIGNAESLRYVFLGNNDFSPGTIPSELGKLTLLEEIFFANLNLRGTIPTEVGLATTFLYFSIQKNQITGPIPSEIGRMTALRQLLVLENELTSTIPIELGNLKDLERFSSFYNDLSGSMPTEICANRDDAVPPGKLEKLHSDCNSQMACSCCTLCVN